jgi:prenyltransferase beta subunit
LISKRRLVAALSLAALLVAPAVAAAPSPTHQTSLDRSVRYLQDAQQGNGGFGRAGEPSQISSAWTALALAAAGINPQDQALPGGVDAYSFLVDHFQQGVEEEFCAPIACTTALERELMVVNASGAPPHDFAGVDLVRALLARELPGGSFPFVPDGEPQVNDTVFAILALAPVDEAVAQAPIQNAAEWVEAAQQDDGGWSWKDRDAPDEVDTTGAAIQALVAAGRAGGDAVEEGLEYLRKAQNPDGGFPEFPGNPESNVASTAWAVQAIWSVGENPESWRTGSGHEPLDYMESLQEADGHIRWKRSSDLNGVWMTAYTVPAYAGQNWPIPDPPRARPPQAPPQSGGQGEGSQSGDGTIAGGGGRGAPLFSRPKPQSRGRTPGAARVVRNQTVHPVNHSRTRRGENTRQPGGTETAEPAKRQPAPREVETVGAASGSAGPGSGSAGDGLGAVGSSSSQATGSGRQSPGPGSGPEGSAAAASLAASEGEPSAGREVSGLLIGGSARTSAQGVLAFGAPGLHSAGAGPADSPWVAIGIGAAALLLAFLGAQWERRRGELIL